MELFKQICVGIFIIWQISSLVFGLVWLLTFFEYLYKQHRRHVDAVKDNESCIESIIDYLNGTYVPGNEFRYAYVRFKKSHLDDKEKKK